MEDEKPLEVAFRFFLLVGFILCLWACHQLFGAGCAQEAAPEAPTEWRP